MLRRHFRDHAAAGKRCFASQQHLGAHDQVAVKQATQANQNNGAVRRDVTQLVGCARLGSQHPACSRACCGIALLQLDLPATRSQLLAKALGRFFGGAGHIRLSPVAKGLEALLANVFLVSADISQIFGCMARHAQAGTDHQKRQNQQKPPGAVNGIELERQKQLRPEGAELVDVVDQRLMLLEHRTDNRCDADHRQQ